MRTRTDVLDAYERSIDTPAVRRIVSAYERARKERGLEGFDFREIKPEIYGWIAMLRATRDDGPAFGNRAENREFGEKWQRWLVEGRSLFAKMPKESRALFFLGEWIELRDRADRRANRRFRSFRSMLGWLADRCNFVLDTDAGGDVRANTKKRKAAIAARYFTERCGLALLHTDENGPYRETAALFYQAMTRHRADVDLRRQCEAVAKLTNWEEWLRIYRGLGEAAASRSLVDVSENDLGDGWPKGRNLDDCG
jgi:hypothetical protein